MHNLITKVKSVFNRAKTWMIGHKLVTTIIAVVLILLIGSLFKDSEPALVSEEAAKTNVKVNTVSELVNGVKVTAVGTVEAKNEARLVTEAGGRVTGVFVEIGDYVNAGTILASVENRNEQAALLQAEGAYEAAQAASAQGSIGTSEAEIRLSEARKEFTRASNATYGTVSDVVISNIDLFYANGTGPFPSLRISTRESTSYLSAERLALQTALTTWAKVDLTNASVDSSYEHSNFVRTQISKTLALVDIFRSAVNDEINNSRYTDAEKDNYNGILTGVRAELVAALNTIDSARLGLESAVEGQKKAEIGAVGGVTSAASAQIKQALGIYRAAQANYEKTQVRTPIAGTVNALYLKTGEYVAPSTPAAIVANNNGLEIRTSVSEADAQKLKVGAAVQIEKNATGTITAMGSAIDPTTGKVALTIGLTQSELVANGQTVSIEFLIENKKESTEILLPLAAVKMTGSGPVAFKVNGDNKLESLPLELGAVRGEAVVVVSGVNNDTEIVVDARGLKEGQEVAKLNK